jgi:hypothetical protein
MRLIAKTLDISLVFKKLDQHPSYKNNIYSFLTTKNL